MAGNDLFNCPAEDCDYGPGPMGQVAAHYQGKRNDAHRGSMATAIEKMMTEGPVGQSAEEPQAAPSADGGEVMEWPGEAEAPPAPPEVNELAEELEAEGYEAVDRFGDLPRRGESDGELAGPAPTGSTCKDCGAPLRHLEDALYVCVSCYETWEWEG